MDMVRLGDFKLCGVRTGKSRPTTRRILNRREGDGIETFDAREAQASRKRMC
jgi:hypothetical protein